ncbi:TIGR00282 family metallophosphoesterase [Botrimarina sp.]|uniref:TIGR00282 family metallophosphoesterase n=1 Tax=Botrimarina sp. TaxID=2795802 RepID=UPI0032ECDF57
MLLLFIGDVVGKPGRRIVQQALPGLIAERGIDLVVCNAENAAAGSGYTPKIHAELMGAGVDAITLGDHVYKRREVLPLLESADNVVRPCNMPLEATGRRWAVVESRSGERVLVCCALGQLFMKNCDSPWRAIDSVLAEAPSDVRVRFVDFHAEATGEMQIAGRYYDGRVAALLGTHTHVPTADECVLPGGTAFQCDVGMTGPHDSILGRRIDRVLAATLTGMHHPFDVAEADVRINATLVTIDPASGLATAIERVVVDEQEAQRLAGGGGESSGPG